MAFLRDLPIFLDPDTAGPSWDTTTRLAERFNLTIYDATYLELAQRHHLPIAILDHSLNAAATAISLQPLGR